MVLLLIATLLTGFAWQYWAWDILANLRVQQSVVAVVLAIICGVYRRWVWLGVCIACLMIHLPWFLPDGYRSEGSFDYQLAKFTVCNVNSANRSFDVAIADIVKDEPDVFAVLEITSEWARQIEASTAEVYPYRVVRPDDQGNFGIGLYSRTPIKAFNVFQLNTEINSIEAIIPIGEKEFRVIGTHPLPPIRPQGFANRNRHLNMLAERVRQPIEGFQGYPTVVMGDLNVTPWSPIFREFEARSGLHRAYQVGAKTVPTWYVLPTFLLGLSLDHVLHSEDLECLTCRIGGPIGSDHRSVTVTVGGLSRGTAEVED